MNRVAGPRELTIAAAIFGAILAAFFGGYELGKAVAYGTIANERASG